jgi:thioredoxin reductase
MGVTRKVLALVIGPLCVSPSVFAAELEWNYNGQAVVVCQGGDSATVNAPPIAFAGNEISLVFNNMHLQLNQPTSPNADRKNCHIIIPTRITKGHYLAELRQRFNF